MNSQLYSHLDEMVKIWRSIQSNWDETRLSWKDVDRDKFEYEHIQEFSDATNTYIEKLRRLAETIQQILNETP
ncbi:MAG: hypothetical protein H8D23_13615 [Candidatus Brocadiales bacterium]|nr:hypothetical protein [Candidatus Brocadiales bacterium]